MIKPMSSREATEAFGTKKGYRLATLKRDIAGKYSFWEKGQVVLAIHLRGSSYMIENIRWRSPFVNICNQLAGVPRSSITLHAPEFRITPLGRTTRAPGGRR